MAFAQMNKNASGAAIRAACPGAKPIRATPSFSFSRNPEVKSASAQSYQMNIYANK